MKTVEFGYECGSLQNSQVDGVYLAPSNMTITGYSISLSMGTPSAPSFFGAAYTSVVLFKIYYSPQSPDPMPQLKVTQTSGSNPAGIGVGGPSNSILFCAIMKHLTPGAYNEHPCVTGLNIPITQGTPITCHVEHAGNVSDFECQVTLYYT